MVSTVTDLQDEAKRLAGDNPIEWGRFLAIDVDLQKAGEKPVSRLMQEIFLNFYRSGCTTLCMGIGQRGTKSTTTIRIQCIPEILLAPYEMSSGSVPVWPIVSKDIAEAQGRVENVVHYLKKLGYSELPRRPKSQDKMSLGAREFVVVGGATVHMIDGYGNPTEIAVTARELGAVSGFTGRSCLLDEVDLWDHGVENERRAPVAEHIIETIAGRGARQGDTKIIMASRLFSPDAPLSSRCKDGDTPERYIARLGEHGSILDLRAREWLSGRFQRLSMKAPSASRRNLYRDLADDPRLHEDPDPNAYAIPSWAAFPSGPDDPDAGLPPIPPHEERPEHAIQECFRLASASIRNVKDILDGLFRAYGSRGYSSGSHAWLDRGLVDDCVSPERIREWNEVLP